MNERKILIDKVEQILLEQYSIKEFLTEDDIIDICFEYDLELLEIDRVCSRILNKKVLLHDNEKLQDEETVDRSQIDYEELLEKIKTQYPNCTTIIKQIKSITPPQSREWQMLINDAQGGNLYAKERITQMYLRTVMKLAYDYSSAYYCDFEDAFQYGVIGLITAIEKFDTTSPETFVSYYPLWVRQTIQRHIEIRGTVMRYPVHYKDKLLSAVNAIKDDIIEDDIEGAIEGLTLVEMEELFLSQNVSKDYLYPYRDEFEEIWDGKCLEDEVCNKLIGEEVRNALECLSERERYVLNLRFGLEDDTARTLEEVGQILDVTRERIRQIEAKTIRKLRVTRVLRGLEEFVY